MAPSTSRGNTVSFGTVMRGILALVVTGALVMVVWQQVEQRRMANEYNRIIADLVNQMEYERGYRALCDLRRRVDGSMARRIEGDMALCAKAIADDPTKALAESAAWYRRAYEADPTSLNDRQKREMRLGEGVNAKAVGR